MDTKAFSKIWIIIILIIFIAGGFLAWQYFGMPKEKVEVPEEKTEEAIPEETIGDETADWKTFNHPFYRFQIKFPSDWGGSADNFKWMPGTIGPSDEVLVFCPLSYGTCTEPTAPGGPIRIIGPILLFICEEGSWKAPDEKCETEGGFEAHYYASIWKPKLEDAVKRIDLPLSRDWLEKGRILKAELILFDSAYETVFDKMASVFEAFDLE